MNRQAAITYAQTICDDLARYAGSGYTVDANGVKNFYTPDQTGLESDVHGRVGSPGTNTHGPSLLPGSGTTSAGLVGGTVGGVGGAMLGSHIGKKIGVGKTVGGVVGGIGGGLAGHAIGQVASTLQNYDNSPEEPPGFQEWLANFKHHLKSCG